MSLLTHVPEPNLWNDICKEFAKKNNPVDEDTVSVDTNKENYDAAKSNPVFYGKLYSQIDVDTEAQQDFDPALSHPSCVGYAFVDRPEKEEPPEPELPNKDTCLPPAYLESYIFPLLLPCFEEMLRQAKLERCFERKRTKFNALDFATEYLYNKHKKRTNEAPTPFEKIPFVEEWWKEHPRPPLPKSLLWSESEAALIIQSHWRGYKVRCEGEVQELRVWQRDWRDRNSNINVKVEEFWSKRLPPDEATEVEKSETRQSVGKIKSSSGKLASETTIEQ